MTDLYTKNTPVAMETSQTPHGGAEMTDLYTKNTPVAMETSQTPPSDRQGPDSPVAGGDRQR
jgi:hypothetical protein